MPTTDAPTTSEQRYLPRPGGRIAYTVTGTGPLVVLVPGMGDLASTWRDVAGPLAAAGHRVAVTDLRGHGGSGTTFATHGDAATGADLLALVEHLDAGPAVLAGNSMGASSAAWAAAERPDLVAGLVLVAPFLRERVTHPAVRLATRTLYRALFARPWGARAWAGYYRGPLNRGAHAPWLDEHVADVRAALRRPGYLRSLRQLAAQLDHRQVEVRLAEITAPAVVLIGDHDPDYPDPAAELAWAAAAIGARPVAVPDAAHYPQHQAPGVVLAAAHQLLGTLPRDGARWATPSTPGPRA
ncbi:alpha/beta fold hydrolase [Cellulomonas hominis]